MLKTHVASSLPELQASVLTHLGENTDLPIHQYSTSNVKNLELHKEF